MATWMSHPAMIGPTDVTVRIRPMLDEVGVESRNVQHDPTRTCDESAAARGETTRVDSKAIVLNVGDTFRRCVLCVAEQIHSNRVRCPCLP